MDSFSDKKKSNDHRRYGVHKNLHKEHRFSKESIGQPMQMEKNGRLATISNSMDNLVPSSKVMELIIVYPDDKGYGLTLSSDIPVQVQTLKKDGPSAVAGVQPKDIIYKINNISVKNMNRDEVVKLIKEQSYIAMAVLRSNTTPPGGSPSSMGKSRSLSTLTPHLSHRSSLYEEKVETIQKMLEHEKSEVERIKEEYARNPEPKILKDLGQAQKLKQDLEKQLWKAKSMKEKSERDRAATSYHDHDSQSSFLHDHLSQSEESSKKPERNDENPDHVITVNDRTSQSGVPPRFRREPPTDAGDTESQQNPSSTMVVSKSDNTTIGNMNDDMNNAIRRASGFADADLTLNKSENSSDKRASDLIMSFEDDDEDMSAPGTGPTVDSGPFSNFEVLRQRPAHLAVFFNYVIDSREPGNFLLHMAVESYKLLNSVKDFVKVGDVIYQTYLAPDSICPVLVDNGIVQSIDSVIHAKSSSDETLKGIFDPAVQVALKEVRQQLADYCVTREQGMGKLYGEDKLEQAMVHNEQSSDGKLVDDILTPTFTKMQKISYSDDLELARINIKLEALQAFMCQYGTKKGKKTSKIYSKLRSKPTPIAKGGRMSGSMDSIIDDPKDKRLSGIGQIFGGKKYEKSRAKSEKPKSHHDRSSSGSKRSKASRRHTIRDIPPVFVVERLKQNKLTTSLSSDTGSTVASAISFTTDAWGLGRLTERQEANSKLILQERPKSAQFAENTRIDDSAQLFPAGVDINTFQAHTRLEDLQHGGDADSLSLADNSSAVNRSSSFGTNLSESKRSIYSTKSKSDPDHDQVEQAISQHNTGRSDQSEALSRPHGLYSTESLQSIFPDAKLMDLFASVDKDPEIDIDDREQHWTDIVSKSVKKSLDKKEIERQQIMNELITTEQHHVRDLKILEKLFYEPLLSFGILTQDEANLAFRNLPDILKLHRDFNTMLQEKKVDKKCVVDQLGDIVLARFDGEGGTTFKNECATYCGNQSTALGFIKEKSKKSPAFNQFLENAYKHPVCRRLNLKDFIPMEFQRLTKYPLLLENIVKHTKKKNEEEIKKLRTVCGRCREILTFVNETVKQAEDEQKIIEIEKNLDREPIMKMKPVRSKIEIYVKRRLTDKTAIHQGLLSWRIQGAKIKLIPLHCILYDDVMVLLQKQEDRYVLRCQEVQTKVYDPFIGMNGIYARNVAVDKRAFYVVSYQSALMYEFVCSSAAAMKEWVNIISKTSKNVEPTPSMNRRSVFITVPPPSVDETVENEKPDKILPPQTVPAGEVVGRAEDNEPSTPEEKPSNEYLPPSFYPSSTPNFSERSEESCNRIIAMNQEILDALSSKYELLASLSNLPVSELERMLEMCLADTDPDPSTLIKHAVVCNDKLSSLINSVASPDKVYVKSQDETESKRFSLAEQRLSFQTDVASPSNSEQWATRVPHPGDKPISSPEAPSFPDSMSETPFSENDELYPNSIQSPSTDSTSQTDENHTLEDAVESTNDGLVSSEDRPRPKSYLSPSEQSDPPPGFDLCVSPSSASFNKMIDVALMLQAQLTRLARVNEERDKHRALLIAENQQLRNELADSEVSTDLTQTLTAKNEPPPSYYDE